MTSSNMPAELAVVSREDFNLRVGSIVLLLKFFLLLIAPNDEVSGCSVSATDRRHSPTLINLTI